MDDPWFITYRGRGKLQITPINAKGWAALAAASLVSITPLIVAGTSLEESPTLLVALLLVMVAILVLFMRWAMSRSDIIDVDAILAERRASKRPGKRR